LVEVATSGIVRTIAAGQGRLWRTWQSIPGWVTVFRPSGWPRTRPPGVG